MKAKIFNLTIYIMLGWSILSAVYLALPIEYQEMLPQMNWLTAVISGGSTALLGTGGLAVKTWLTNAKVQSDSKYALLADKFLNLTTKYDDLSVKYNDVVKAIEENNTLLKVELKTKLDNPLITETSRQAIEGVIYGSKEE